VERDADNGAERRRCQRQTAPEARASSPLQPRQDARGRRAVRNRRDADDGRSPSTRR
jgi:hypothetical protein